MFTMKMFPASTFIVMKMPNAFHFLSVTLDVANSKSTSRMVVIPLV